MFLTMHFSHFKEKKHLVSSDSGTLRLGWLLTIVLIWILTQIGADCFCIRCKFKRTSCRSRPPSGDAAGLRKAVRDKSLQMFLTRQHLQIGGFCRMISHHSATTCNIPFSVSEGFLWWRGECFPSGASAPPHSAGVSGWGFARSTKNRWKDKAVKEGQWDKPKYLFCQVYFHRLFGWVFTQL